jgi:MoxR-like ATPase
VQLGASPRGSQSLMLVARARAVMAGRDFVTPDDVKRAAVPVLAHRLTLTTQAWAGAVSADQLVREIVERVPGPPAVGARSAGAAG